MGKACFPPDVLLACYTPSPLRKVRTGGDINSQSTILEAQKILIICVGFKNLHDLMVLLLIPFIRCGIARFHLWNAYNFVTRSSWRIQDHSTLHHSVGAFPTWGKFGWKRPVSFWSRVSTDPDPIIVCEIPVSSPFVIIQSTNCRPPAQHQIWHLNTQMFLVTYVFRAVVINFNINYGSNV